LRPAGASDALEETVDYSELVASVSEIVAHSQCKLLERLAQLIADKCLSYRLVNSVRVTIEKPAALKSAKAIISIHRIKSHQA
jgi:dihydroneopterin aldolase